MKRLDTDQLKCIFWLTTSLWNQAAKPEAVDVVFFSREPIQAALAQLDATPEEFVKRAKTFRGYGI